MPNEALQTESWPLVPGTPVAKEPCFVCGKPATVRVYYPWFFARESPINSCDACKPPAAIMCSAKVIETEAQ